MFFGIASSLAAGYLIGSISFAVLIARQKGVDIFKVGSGNPGATNVMRSLGKVSGYTCFFLDAMKGVMAVMAGRGIAVALDMPLQGQILAATGLLGAILGHSFSAFLRFRGGKGVATTVGGLFALMWPVMLAGAVIWLAVFAIFRYVSLASLALGASLPLSALILQRPTFDLIFCLLLTGLITLRHRSNIQRLMKGTENRAGRKRS